MRNCARAERRHGKAMILTIDNLQGQGPENYTQAVDGTNLPKVQRKLNQPAELQISLLANSPGFVVPAMDARVIVLKANGNFIFTGYVTSAPEYEYLGWGEQGPVYRYNLVAQSDEILLDRKALPNRAPFVDRSAGNALSQLAQICCRGGLTRPPCRSLILSQLTLSIRRKVFRFMRQRLPFMHGRAFAQ